MMSRRECIVVLILLAIIVSLLVLLYSPQLFSTSEPKVLNISVITDNAPDEYHAGFRMGVEQAALDYNVDIRYITMPEDTAVEQQASYLARELEGQADAVILLPLEEGYYSELFANAAPAKPVVTTEKSFSGAAAFVSQDDEEMGALLASAVAESFDKCLVFLEDSEDKNLVSRCDIFLSRMEALGKTCQIVYGHTTASQKIAAIKRNTPGSALVGFEKNALIQLAEYAAESNEKLVYGTGFTVPLLSYLEKGVVRRLVVTSEYDTGYLCVRNAVGLVNREKTLTEELPIYEVSAQNMYTEPLEKLLFPIS